MTAHQRHDPSSVRAQIRPEILLAMVWGPQLAASKVANSLIAVQGCPGRIEKHTFLDFKVGENIQIVPG